MNPILPPNTYPSVHVFLKPPALLSHIHVPTDEECAVIRSFMDYSPMVDSRRECQPELLTSHPAIILLDGGTSFLPLSQKGLGRIFVIVTFQVELNDVELTAALITFNELLHFNTHYSYYLTRGLEKTLRQNLFAPLPISQALASSPVLSQTPEDNIVRVEGGEREKEVTDLVNTYFFKTRYPEETFVCAEGGEREKDVTDFIKNPLSQTVT